jgi:SNF2 family DNA or RNA helicase
MHPLWNSFTYFPYQRTGINWMLNKEKNGTMVWDESESDFSYVYGGFQCDDMGLGKTIQTIATMINNPKPLTLLLAPLAMIETWSSVCSRAGIRVLEIRNGSWIIMNGKAAVPEHFHMMRPSIYITNYEKLIHSPSLCTRKWDRIVLDEAHKIRNGNGQFAKQISRLSAPIRWALTGTPLVNSLKDIVSLLSFIGVPTSPSFSWSPHYMMILPDLLLHRSLDSLRSTINGAPPVPEVIEEVLPFYTEEEEDFYKGVQCTDDKLNKKYTQDVMTSVQSFQLLLRLRQLSVHPQIYINAKRREDSTYDREDWVALTTKFNRIKQLIQEDDDTRVHKYIVFCQFMEEMNLLAEELRPIVPEVLLYNGSMNQTERTDVLTHSKKTNTTTVLLLQLQAGGVGLNLQEYDRIIFVSPWWTSALMDQAVARAVRMGQTEVVKVYHLRLIDESNDKIINIDTTMQKKADEKRNMLKKIFNHCEQEQNK